jgi:hypothetical protein
VETLGELAALAIGEVVEQRMEEAVVLEVRV